MKIRVQGSIIQLIRYQINYMINETSMIEYAHTQEEANEIAKHYQGQIMKLEVTGQEWIDGIDVGKTNMPYDRAMEIAAMGEEGYKQYLEKEKKKNPNYLLTENEMLKTQVTDLQLALAELYETIAVKNIK